MSGALVYRVNEVAKLLQCGPRSVYRLVENGELRAVKIGRLVRIPESALNMFLAGNEENAVAMTTTLSAVPDDQEGRSDVHSAG